MNGIEILNLVIGAVGAAGGVTGVVALFQTHKGNELAQTANSSSEKAAEAAMTANELAAKANEAGEHANLIAQRALDASADQTVYQWAAWLDAKTSTLTVVNDCALDARDVHVVVRHEDQTIADRHVDLLPAFKEVPLETGLLAQKLKEKLDALRRSGVIGTAFVRLDIHITWTSELGVRRTCHSQQGFGYTKRKKILD